jgi:hypothetical protein
VWISQKVGMHTPFFASRTVPSSSSSSPSEEGLIRAIIPSLTVMSTKTNPSLSPDGFVVPKATSGVPFEDETEFRTSSVFVPLSSAKDNKTTGTLAFLTVYDEAVLSGGFIHAAAFMITRACLCLCVRSLSFSHAHKTSSKVFQFLLTRAIFFPKDAKKLTFGGAFYSFFETRRRFVTQKKPTACPVDDG